MTDDRDALRALPADVRSRPALQRLQRLRRAALVRDARAAGRERPAHPAGARRRAGRSASSSITRRTTTGRHRKFVPATPARRLHETHPRLEQLRHAREQRRRPCCPIASGGPCRSSRSTRSRVHRMRRSRHRRQRSRHAGAAACSARPRTSRSSSREPGRVGQVVIALGEFMTDFPMRLQIAVSPGRHRVGNGVRQATRAARLLRGAPPSDATFPSSSRSTGTTSASSGCSRSDWGKHDWSIVEVEVLR